MPKVGITMIALLITIIVLVIITAITIRTITGKDGLVGVTAETAESHEISSYAEQINHTLHSEIIAKSTIGKVATIENVRDALDREDWIKTAVINEQPTTEIGDITAQVVEG